MRAGLPAIGVWRDRVQEAGVAEAAKIIADAGLRVSSLCRGGFLTADDDTAAEAALDDNRRAIVEAATLGTRELIMVVGGLPAASAPGGPALPGTAGATSSAHVSASPTASGSSRRSRPGTVSGSCWSRCTRSSRRTARSSRRSARRSTSRSRSRRTSSASSSTRTTCGGTRICSGRSPERARRDGSPSYQVCDWTLPLAADALLSRGHVGDGYIDFATITRWVAETGYTGDVEVEIFNQSIWDTPGDDDGRDAGRPLRAARPAVPLSGRTLAYHPAQARRRSSPCGSRRPSASAGSTPSRTMISIRPIISWATRTGRRDPEAATRWSAVVTRAAPSS